MVYNSWFININMDLRCFIFNGFMYPNSWMVYNGQSYENLLNMDDWRYPTILRHLHLEENKADLGEILKPNHV